MSEEDQFVARLYIGRTRAINLATTSSTCFEEHRQTSALILQYKIRLVSLDVRDVVVLGTQRHVNMLQALHE